MRKKNILDERLGKTKGSSLEYLDNFMVLDSVGSGDGSCLNFQIGYDSLATFQIIIDYLIRFSEVEDSKDEKTDDEGKREKSDKREDDTNLGSEFIRKVEAYYCEVCRFYLPRLSDDERALRIHCRTKYHFECYVRFGSDKLLEQIQGKKVKNEGDKNEVKTEEKVEDGTKENDNHEEVGEDEDKLWADVSDLLRQVEAEAKSDDEDEESKFFWLGLGGKNFSVFGFQSNANIYLAHRWTIRSIQIERKERKRRN